MQTQIDGIESGPQIHPGSNTDGHNMSSGTLHGNPLNNHYRYIVATGLPFT